MKSVPIRPRLSKCPHCSTETEHALYEGVQKKGANAGLRRWRCCGIGCAEVIYERIKARKKK